MQTIVLKLIPEKLKNPDVDLRYLVPCRIEKVSGGSILDNGYEYLQNDSIGLWLQTEDAKRNYPILVSLLQKELFLENDLSLSAEIYIARGETEEIKNCEKVYPK